MYFASQHFCWNSNIKAEVLKHVRQKLIICLEPPYKSSHSMQEIKKSWEATKKLKKYKTGPGWWP